tara:strand:- start:339 stop:632 length:294 start_codon:yes stop_codon:yes gene_type:complete
VLKYNFITLLKTVSTPQVANAKRIENTATITIKFDDSAREGRVTLFLNSSTDSFIYVNIYILFYYFNKRIFLPNFIVAREERLELPTPGFGDQCSTN